ACSVENQGEEGRGGGPGIGFVAGGESPCCNETPPVQRIQPRRHNPLAGLHQCVARPAHPVRGAPPGPAARAAPHSGAGLPPPPWGAPAPRFSTKQQPLLFCAEREGGASMNPVEIPAGAASAEHSLEGWGRVLFEASDDAIFVHDLEGRILEA